MISLGVDTSTPAGSVGLAEGTTILGEVNLATSRQHQDRLLRTVDFLLDLAGYDMNRVDVLSVSLGPGSFTGIRVGIATVKGLALALGIPVYGLSTLAGMALRYESTDLPVAPLLDARRGRVYAALYEPGGLPHPQLSMEEHESPPETFLACLPRTRILFCGDGALKYSHLIEQIRGSNDRIESKPCFLGTTLARWGGQRRSENSAWSLADLKPNYIRPPDAERPSGCESGPGSPR